jgi:lipoprotein-releasing system ATP-binding protein
MEHKLLELKNVSRAFPHPSRREDIQVLRDLWLDVSAGETVAVTGPSGSGKSTLLHILGALDRPTSGEVLFAGRNLGGLDDQELSHIRNRQIGFVFQLHYLLPHCTVLENVLVPTIPLSKGTDGRDAEERALRLLEKVGLTDFRDHFPAQLSGGELQRAAVARALINQPQLLLADEPTGSLDKDSSDRLAELLVRLNREESTTLILVTHALDLAGLMGTTYRLHRGALQRV